MGKGFQSGMGGFGGMNMNNLLKQVKKMQGEMEKTQETLEAQIFESSVGGGNVSVKVTGKKQIKEIKINKDVVDPEDVEMLEDLIMTCINDAMNKADSALNSEMSKYNVPGLNF